MSVESNPNPPAIAKVTVRGRFTVRSCSDIDITPNYRKERALIALLAVSPDGRCSRSWLQSKLWSEKPPEKASANLRRALTNLKRSLGEHTAILHSNRLELWLDNAVEVDWLIPHRGRLSLLELVEAPDPAFDEWLRDLRAEDDSKVERAQPEGVLLPTETKKDTIIVIGMTRHGNSAEAQFLEMTLIGALAARFRSEGAERVYTDTVPEPQDLDRAAAGIFIEISSLVDGGWWNVHLRALADQDRRFLWSGRLRVPMNVGTLSEGGEIQGFVSQVLSQVLLRFQSFRLARKSRFIRMHRAATALYVSDLDRMRKAEDQLVELSEGDGQAVALAWRGFARLAIQMEFPNHSPDAAAEATWLANEALELDPANPLVNSIASRVSLDLLGDLDRAEYFATRALAGDEQNPYALQAASRVALLAGKSEEAARFARVAQSTAQGLPHKFAWDMEVCLTALANGQLEKAGIAAHTAHLSNKHQRAALRYLVAINLLTGDSDTAERFAESLRYLEPAFKLSDLGRDDYPVLTLRKTGYASEISGLP